MKTAAIASLILVSANLAGAQPAQSFADVTTRLRAGDRIEITDTNLKKVDGIYAGVAGDALRISRFGSQREVLERDTLEIRRERPEDLHNSAIIGAIGTLTASQLYLQVLCKGDGDGCWGRGTIILTPLAVGFGAVLGMVLDDAVKSYDVLYERPRRQSRVLRLSPALLPRGAGLALSVSY